MNGFVRSTGVLLLIASLVGACGTPEAPRASAPPAQSAVPSPPADSVPPTGSVPPAASAPADSGAAGMITVPDVSGMNHQQAQDTMQAAGLFNLREVDGKGLGRALVVDRNWVQTGQSPAPGTRVTPGTEITLTAVKYTD